MTVAELCDMYLAEGAAHKKASTLKADLGRILHHIKPQLGQKRVEKLARADIERMMIAVKTGSAVQQRPAITNDRRGVCRPVGPECGAMRSPHVYSSGVRGPRGLRPDNPALGIKKPPIQKMERFLSEEEIARLASALEAEARVTSNPYPAAAIKLLLLTGRAAVRSPRCNGRTWILNENACGCPTARLAPK